MPKLTQTELKNALHYDPETGLWSWLATRCPRAQAGAIAGGLSKTNGYIIINLRSTWHRAHRLAWLYMTGLWPPSLVDHINGVRSDNRWSNLRLATPEQNNANSKRPTTNTSGYKGVYFSKHANKWRAQISISNRTKNLGYFDAPEEAHQAYLEAAEQRFGEFSRAS